MRGACRLRGFWRFNLILTHCGFLERASAKQSEISEHSEHSDGLADARTMVCRSWLTAYPPWRRWGVVWSGTAATACRGGGNVRLLSSSSPFVIVSAGGGGDAIHRVRASMNLRSRFLMRNPTLAQRGLLRPTYISPIRPIHPIRPIRPIGPISHQPQKIYFAEKFAQLQLFLYLCAIISF